MNQFEYLINWGVVGGFHKTLFAGVVGCGCNFFSKFLLKFSICWTICLFIWNKTSNLYVLAKLFQFIIGKLNNFHIV